MNEASEVRNGEQVAQPIKSFWTSLFSQSESELTAESSGGPPGHISPQPLSNTDTMALIWKNVVRSFRQQSDSKDTIIASLQQTIDEDRRQLEALEHDMRIKDETIFVLRKAEADCRMLQEQLVAFKTTEYADSRSLHQIFEDLQDDIDDLAHNLCNKLNSGVILGLDSALSLRLDNNPRLHQLSDFFALSIAHDFGPHAVLTYAMTYIICSTLVDTMFSKFCVAEGEIGDALTTVYRRMQQSRSQVVRGRWRSMAFQALRAIDSDVETASNMATDILQQISQLITVVTQPSGDYCQWVVDDSLPRAVTLVNTALKLHDAIQGEYVSVDYRVFLPKVFETVQSDQVEEDEVKKKVLARGSSWPAVTTVNMSGAGVLLPTSLGLHAARVEAGVTLMSKFIYQAKVLPVVPLAQQ